jgi:hypothetical protein
MPATGSSDPVVLSRLLGLHAFVIGAQQRQRVRNAIIDIERDGDPAGVTLERYSLFDSLIPQLGWQRDVCDRVAV